MAVIELALQADLLLDLVVLFCSHGNKEVFSCLGIQLAVDWFVEKGHKDITVFVPAWRKEQSRPDAPITGTKALLQLATLDKMVSKNCVCVGGGVGGICVCVCVCFFYQHVWTLSSIFPMQKITSHS